MSSEFYQELKSFNNLFEAWRHVRKSALQSTNKTIASTANEFENNISTNIRSIAGKLTARSYKFPPSLGVLKDKKKREALNKPPRPIVIGTIESRVVQRAILQVLQPEKDSHLYNISGRLKNINESPYGIGGIPSPYGGVSVGISSILKDINEGFDKFYKSDIQAFFTRISHASVVDFVSEHTKDKEISFVFSEALKVELINKDELGDYSELFPEEGVGVPQGSSLSALAGNILLAELDEMLNSDSTRAYRYIDDFIILGKNIVDVDQAKSKAKKWLKKQGMSLYEPSKGSDKAESGNIKNGVNFLGCRISKNHVEPGKLAKRNLIDKIDKEISNSKKYISIILKDASLSRQSQSAYIQTLSKIDKIIYGWGHSFSFCNSRLPFRVLDDAINKKVELFESWYLLNIADKSIEQKRRSAGISLLYDIESTYSNILKNNG